MGLFSCDECDEALTFQEKSNLIKHVKTVHKKEESKTLKRKLENTNSTTSKKSKDETFSCEDCEYKTKCKKSLTKHKETSCAEKLD